MIDQKKLQEKYREENKLIELPLIKYLIIYSSQFQEI